jgi:uncharacterized membrane protein HdeD (DUF308 family)
MPFAFIIIGIVLLVSGVRQTSSNLLTLVSGDLTGENNFIYWILSILLIGAVGYIPDLKTLSRAFLVLVLLVLVIREDDKQGGGFFAEFQKAVSNITKGGT